MPYYDPQRPIRIQVGIQFPDYEYTLPPTQRSRYNIADIEVVVSEVRDDYVILLVKPSLDAFLHHYAVWTGQFKSILYSWNEPYVESHESIDFNHDYKINILDLSPLVLKIDRTQALIEYSTSLYDWLSRLQPLYDWLDR